MRARLLPLGLALSLIPGIAGAAFKLEEATIAGTQAAILKKEITSEALVKAYLKRIKAYNGVCVKEPEGILGRIETIPDAGQVNALSTLNLRPALRRQWGFDERKARSMTDAVDADPAMPDALETARAQDAAFARTGKLVGPLHGVVVSIKDQYDTFDLRTTSGGDAPYANDRPPQDSEFVVRLRKAGAIVIGKANMGEYAAGPRSAFGGTFCNPYDTERSPGGSSGGSGSSVATNMVLCSIGEESGPSIRSPAKNNNVVGLSPTQELVSRHGMIPASFMNDRVGPLCRTVEDAAKVLDVIAGYDEKDALTAFAVNRQPQKPYASYVSKPGAKPLEGLRIGVIREYMDKTLFTKADEETIDIVDREIARLKTLGATVVDPGAGGALFQECLAKTVPSALNSMFTAQFPELFPKDADQIPLLVKLSFDSSAFPKNKAPSIRGLGPSETVGEGGYTLDRYLALRGDANIKSIDDLIGKSRFYTDIRDNGGFGDKKKILQDKSKDKTLELGPRLQMRFALQQVALQCMGQMKLDALTYPTGNIPPPKLGAPTEPSKNGRSQNAWTLLGANGFPAITVPAGFTTEVYDRERDAKAEGGTRLLPPVKAALPVGIDFMARPFDEPTLVRIASAYEAVSKHRREPVGFGPVAP